ncbi:MAG: amidohydrolase [Gammaproteobacteria bacterium]|nr:amidohydrolase [Gammaproteobacteria bacterium]MDH5799302.1 amidohydrolase [Gammaproteobacteria bacterium]
MNRRSFLTVLAAGGLGMGATGFWLWPREGILNSCLSGPLPKALADHELLRQAWEGLDPQQVWDCHVHLIGTGDNNSGIWVNPNMQSLMHPIQYAQFQFYMNAACVGEDQGKENRGSPHSVDKLVVDRLLSLQKDFPPGAKMMLLAFDYFYDEQGKQQAESSPFHTPNAYAYAVVKQHPLAFEWIASIHPYRADCVEELQWCVERGTRAIKWLPGAMGIDPASPLCDRFYDALVKYHIPILCHAGEENAVSVEGGERLNNPLLLRRALDRGVRVIFAHCASLGQSHDIDKEPNEAKAPMERNFNLFKRLIADSSVADRVYGDISAILQINRDKETIADIVSNPQWHKRLINGSDYPLPGVIPLVDTHQYVDWGFIPADTATRLTQIRPYNPILYDFLLKRVIRVNTHALSDDIFESRRIFVQ